MFLFRVCFFFFFKQKTAYEMLLCDWSSDVCSSDLTRGVRPGARLECRSRGHDIIDEQDSAAAGTSGSCHEAPGEGPQPLAPRQAELTAPRAATLQGAGVQRQEGASGDGAGQPFSLVVSPAVAAPEVQGNRHDEIGTLGEDQRGEPGDHAPAEG